MRAKFVIATLVQVGALALTHAAFAQEVTQPQRIRLSDNQYFAIVRDMRRDSDALLNSPASRALPVGSSTPAVDFGRFHASLGGMNGRHMQLGSYRLDTSEFLNSSISGSIDGRGAHLMFTLPTQ